MKKVIISLIVAILCLGVFSSALADNDLYSTYQAEWGAMPKTKASKTKNRPAGAIQYMLLYYDSSTHDLIADYGGVDSIFGSHTTSAVKIFQSDCGITSDGIVGPATWRNFYNSLEHEQNDPHDTATALVFTLSGVTSEQQVIKRKISETSVSWYNMYGNTVFYSA